MKTPFEIHVIRAICNGETFRGKQMKIFKFFFHLRKKGSVQARSIARFSEASNASLRTRYQSYLICWMKPGMKQRWRESGDKPCRANTPGFVNENKGLKCINGYLGLSRESCSIVCRWIAGEAFTCDECDAKEKGNGDPMDRIIGEESFPFCPLPADTPRHGV